MSAVVATVGTPTESFTATCSCPPPASIANGDLLIGIVDGLYQDSTTGVVLSGWTEKLTFAGADTRISILYKYASGESGNYDFVMSGALYTNGVVLRITGAVTSGDPFDVIGSGSSGSSTSAAAASVTTTQADTLLLYVAGWVNGSASVSSGPSGMTSQATQTILAVYSEAIASAGATGTRTATLSSSETWAAVIGAIKSAGGGGGSSIAAIQQYHQRLRASNG
jgi:hypothetical protein